jgi:small ubiquitin-related modifier
LAPSLVLKIDCTFNPQPIKVRLFYNDRFQKLKQIFARSLDLPESQIILKYDGITLNSLHTPSHFPMQNDDVIVATLLSDLKTNSSSTKTGSLKQTNNTGEQTNVQNQKCDYPLSAQISPFKRDVPQQQQQQEEEEEDSLVKSKNDDFEHFQATSIVYEERENFDFGQNSNSKRPLSDRLCLLEEETFSSQQPQSRLSSIVLKVLLEGEQRPLQFRLRRHDPFSKLINAICERRSITPDRLRLTFDGVVVLPHQCPQQLEMQDEDLLDAVILS